MKSGEDIWKDKGFSMSQLMTCIPLADWACELLLAYYVKAATALFDHLSFFMLFS